MKPEPGIRKWVSRSLALNQYTITALVILVCVAIIAVVYQSQKLSEQRSLPPIETTSTKEQYEIAKLAAEIRQIRSDTSGSLFWLKMIALFVTVGGAVGGYLIGQSQTAKKRIEFENRKNIDSAYQGIVLELADKSPLLRAAAAVKLGTILRSFPVEWTASDARKAQLIQMTKQVLAASLAIEKDPKVLKTLTIALVLHKPWENDSNPVRKKYADLRELDLSGARAADAYWARVDFSYSDFYRADSSRTSFREAVLEGAQFRNTKLQDAVFIKANCKGANFKLADLRNADLTDANLEKATFEGAKVFGCKLTGVESSPDMVDSSPAGDGSQMISLQEWLAANR
jgi:uncharacterized protein YjbI with pentapeptide repeats